MSGRKWRNGAGAFAFAAIVLLVIGLTVGSGGTSNTSANEKPSASPAPNSSDTNVTCDATWKMKAATPANGRWEANGVASIKKAHTKAQARQAAFDWLHANEGNPGLLAGTAAYLLNKQVDPATLVDNDGCATPAAVTLTQELSAALALADITPSQAPADGINTFTSDGRTYAEGTAGVTGDRKAIRVVTKDGEFWVMARCGNPVTRHHTPLPRKHHPRKPHHRHHNVCVPPSSPGPGFKFNKHTCQWYKPPTTFNCQQNGTWTKNCPPNQVDQPVQHNPCCDTGPTKGAPSSPPPPEDVPSTTPTSGNDNGYGSGSTNTGSAPGGSTSSGSGTQTGNPTPSSSPSPNDGNTGQDHSGGPPPPP